MLRTTRVDVVINPSGRPQLLIQHLVPICSPVSVPKPQPSLLREGGPPQRWKGENYPLCAMYRKIARASPFGRGGRRPERAQTYRTFAAFLSIFIFPALLMPHGVPPGHRRGIAAGNAGSYVRLLWFLQTGQVCKNQRTCRLSAETKDAECR